MHCHQLSHSDVHPSLPVLVIPAAKFINPWCIRGVWWYCERDFRVSVVAKKMSVVVTLLVLQKRLL